MTLNHTLVILWALIQPSPSPPSLPSSGSQPSGQDRNPLNFKASKLDADSVNGSYRREAPQPGLLSPLPGQLAPVLESPVRQKTRCVSIPGPLGRSASPGSRCPPGCPGCPPSPGPGPGLLLAPELTPATGDDRAPLPGAKSGIWPLCILALPLDLRCLPGRPLPFLT